MFDYLKEEDLNDLCLIIKENFDYIPKKSGLNKLMDDNNIIKLVYRENNTIVASVFIETRYNYIKDEKYYYLNYLVVSKKYQRLGIGTKLLNKVEELARYHSIDYIEFTSSRENIYNFYEKNNYIKRDTNVFRKEI